METQQQQQHCRARQGRRNTNDQNLAGQQSEIWGNAHDGTRHELPASSLHQSVQPQHCLTAQVPLSDLKSEWPPPHTPEAPPRSAGAGRARHSLSRYGPEAVPPQHSQRVINPSCTPQSEMAHSLRRHSARDELISLSEALPLSSCWDWIYERSALHPRQ